ncbi:MAG: RDD family protein [Acidimicrobiia bacterium]|nr:RDD family protein [Acidimicrobiia bacterium]MYB72964.1 RDD family protein [Acidimicrobiia bacterium]MYH97959.1 RDD family protein [Acidimicrobiia bacterium]
MSVSAWEPDPTGRHQYRWWDGEKWTDQVADDGVQSVDPVSIDEARTPRQTPPSVPPPPPSSVPGHIEGDPDTAHPELLTMLASRWRRIGAFLLEPVLAAVTLIIGWLIWSLIVYSRGQTPAKQVLRLRVIRLRDHRAAGWGWMALREMVLKTVVGVFLSSFYLVGLVWFIVNGIVFLSNERRQALWDKMLKTVVISDPDHRFKPVPLSRYVSGS